MTEAKAEEYRKDETYRDWTRHDYSQRKLTQVRGHQDTALGTLLGECRQTSDPKVARALARYEQLTALREMVEGNSP
jgi:hypothetical protein